MRILGFFYLFCLTLVHAEPSSDSSGSDGTIPTSGLMPLRQATETQFAFLCLSDTKVADVTALKKSLVKWFKLSSPNEIRNFKYKPKSKSFSWGIGRSLFVATLETLPIPSNDIRYAANNSLHWPDAEKKMLLHQANYTMTCVSIHRTPWHAALDLSHALAAFTENHNTTGIYWGDASIVHNPESFLKQASYQLGSKLKVPSSLWIGILYESDTKGGWNIFTNGMRPLGHRDMEIQGSQLARSSLFTTINKIKHQVLTKQLILSNNLILEGDASSKWKISTGGSVVGKKSLVWILTQQ